MVLFRRADPGSLIATVTLLLFATPAAAGVPPCSQQATVTAGPATQVTVGEEVLIQGFGFFPRMSSSNTPLTNAALIGDRHGRRHRGVHDDHHAGGRRRGPVDRRGDRFLQGPMHGHHRLRGGWRARHPTPTPTPPPTPTPVPPAAELPNVAQHRRRRRSRSGHWARRSWGWRPSPCGRRWSGAAPHCGTRTANAWLTKHEESDAHRGGGAAHRERAAEGYGGTEAVVSYLTEELVARATTSPCSPAVTRRPRRSWSRALPAPCGLMTASSIRWRTRSSSWKRCGPGPPLRRDPLPPRLPPLPAVAAARRAPCHDAPRPARHPGPPAGLHRVQRHAGRLDLERPAIAAAAGQLGRDHPPRPAAHVLEPRYEPGEYLAFLGRISPEKRWTGRSRSPAGPGSTLRDRRQGGRRRREYYEREIEPLLGASHVEFIGEIGPTRRPTSSAAPAPCSSRSTGPSRSGW